MAPIGLFLSDCVAGEICHASGGIREVRVVLVVIAISISINLVTNEAVIRFARKTHSQCWGAQISKAR